MCSSKSACHFPAHHPRPSREIVTIPLAKWLWVKVRNNLMFFPNFRIILQAWDHFKGSFQTQICRSNAFRFKPWCPGHSWGTEPNIPPGACVRSVPESDFTHEVTQLVGGWPTPLKNVSLSFGIMIMPNWMGKKHVPNHQPLKYHTEKKKQKWQSPMWR